MHTHTHTHTHTHRYSTYVCEWVLAQVCLWEEITVLGGEVFQQPAASSLPLCGHWLRPWRARLAFHHTQHMCVCVCVHACPQSSIPACICASLRISFFFSQPFFNLWLTGSVCASTGVRVHICPCACTVSLCVCSPSGSSDSSPASKLPAGPPLSHHSVCHSAAFKQRRSPGIIAGRGRPLLQSAATAAALTHARSLCMCVCVGFCETKREWVSEWGEDEVEKKGSLGGIKGYSVIRASVIERASL